VVEVETCDGVSVLGSCEEEREMRIEGAFRTLDGALNWRMPPET
jgi:hypothetical protein